MVTIHQCLVAELLGATASTITGVDALKEVGEVAELAAVVREDVSRRMRRWLAVVITELGVVEISTKSRRSIGGNKSASDSFFIFRTARRRGS
jgi:hypothetical protein